MRAPHKQRIKALEAQHKDKMMYFCVGIFAFMVDALTFTILRKLNLSIGLANICAMVAGMITSFSLNWRVVFKNKHYKNPIWLMILMFLTLNALNWWFSTNFIGVTAPLISNILNQILNFNVGRSFSEFVAKMASLGFIMIWNFILFKKVVFKEETPPRVIS
jgi:putative flippase GtrA